MHRDAFLTSTCRKKLFTRRDLLQLIQPLYCSIIIAAVQRERFHMLVGMIGWGMQGTETVTLEEYPAILTTGHLF